MALTQTISLTIYNKAIVAMSNVKGVTMAKM